MKTQIKELSNGRTVCREYSYAGIDVGDAGPVYAAFETEYTIAKGVYRRYEFVGFVDARGDVYNCDIKDLAL